MTSLKSTASATSNGVETQSIEAQSVEMQSVETRSVETQSEKQSPQKLAQATAQATPDLWQAIRTVMELQNQAPPLQAVPRTSTLPLSWAQEQLWWLAQLKPDSAAHNIPFAFRITGSLHLQALTQSFDEILRRHEALRTTVVMVDEHPTQAIAPPTPLFIPVIDLRSLAAPEREAQALQLLRPEASTCFDLTQDALLRARLLRLADQEFWLLITVHHIGFDGWSEGRLFQELSQLYQTFAASQPIDLPALPLQYADFAAWQRQWLQGDVLAPQLAFWQEQLHGLTAQQLPFDFPRTAKTGATGDRHTFTVPASLTQSLKQLSRRNKNTLFTTLLTALKIGLHSYSGQTDLFVCTPTANRTRAETQSLIGYFVNLLVLRSHLAAELSLQELLRQEHLAVSTAYAYQHLPLQQLVDALEITVPLSQVMFVLQNVPQQTLELSDCTVTAIDTDNGTADFDLALSITETAGELKGIFKYNTHLFRAETVAQIAQRFQQLLEAMVANPERSLAALLADLDLQPQLSTEGDRLSSISSSPRAAYMPPKDELEQQLIQIWEGFFDVQPIGTQDSFFDLGGHSLLAVRLFAAIEEALGVKLPLSILYQATTVEQIAHLLRQEDWTIPWSSLVAIQPKGSKPPLFCAHGAGSNVLHYRLLSQYLGAEQPFYGLQPRGLDGDQIPCDRIEEMAANYIQEIRTVQPEGPYRLGGSSMGGMIALEMAHQLIDAGQTVEIVLMLDTYGPNYRRPLSFSESILHHTQNFLRLSPKAKLTYLQARGQSIRRKLTPLTHKLSSKLSRKPSRKPDRPSTQTKAPVPQAAPTPDDLPVVDLPVVSKDDLVKRANTKAAKSYQPKSYSGQTVLFKASERPVGWAIDSALGWGDLISSLNVLPVPGAHDTMFREPNVPVLSEKLRQCLQALDQE